jgi:phosphoribosylformylglycinamidine cyclo-ligase
VFAHTLAALYPETYDSAMPDELVYAGTKALTDIDPHTGLTYGKLVLSPTRTYAPVIHDMLQRHRPHIHGMVHCSGGAQTKILHFIHNLHVIKDNLFPVPPLFALIQQESGAGWEEMYRVFNMGHRMELYVAPGCAEQLIATAQQYHVGAQVIGHVEAAPQAALTIRSEKGEFHYG